MSSRLKYLNISFAIIVIPNMTMSYSDLMEIKNIHCIVG